MNWRSLFFALDFWAACAASVLVRVTLPALIKNELAKDFYGVGLSILAILFSVFFAALAIIMASTDDEFVKFMEAAGDYSRLISTMRFTLYSLFIALIVSILLYVYSAYRISSGVGCQHWWLLDSFSFLFIYALFASLSTTHDAIRYSQNRVRFLQKGEKN